MGSIPMRRERSSSGCKPSGSPEIGGDVLKALKMAGDLEQVKGTGSADGEILPGSAQGTSGATGFSEQQFQAARALLASMQGVPVDSDEDSADEGTVGTGSDSETDEAMRKWFKANMGVLMGQGPPPTEGAVGGASR